MCQHYRSRDDTDAQRSNGLRSGRYKTVLFLTDSVFIVLFAYFDESMSSIGGYEP